MSLVGATNPRWRFGPHARTAVGPLCERGAVAVTVEQHGAWMDVTFTYRPAPEDGAVLLVSGFVSGGVADRVLHPAGDATVARTWRLPADFLGTYLFWVGRAGVVLPDDPDELIQVMYSDAGRPVADPDHDDRLVYPVDPEHAGPPFVQSVLRGPTSTPEPFLGAPLLGHLGEHRIVSPLLGDERRVWVHESVGCDGSGPPPALMVVFDGGVYAHLLHTPEQVDALVTEGVLPPLVTLYCHYSSDAARNAELMCRADFADFADFVVDELVPWAAARWQFTNDAARSVVAGASLGGLAAAWLAYRHPGRFGHVIAQSPSFWWHPDSPAAANWLAGRWATDGPPDVRVYAEMGTFEQRPGADGRSAFDHTVDFVETARRRGNDVVFTTFAGGHDFLAWRATFPRALRWVAGGLPPAQ